MRESIIAQGVIEPLVVRRLADGTYQLVAGERRWRGGKAAQEKLGQPVWLPCQARELTDEAALDMMVAENLHREDLHPLDEAEGFNHLLNQVKVNGQPMTLEELALRVGKKAGFIHQRLRLCALVEAGKELLAEDKLPLGQALEIAKFEPEVQEHLLGQCFYTAWRGGQQVDAVMPLAELRRYIQQNVLLDLKRAPFSTTATNLREDGLACAGCPQRTGAAPTLWQDLEGESGKGPDNCTNPTCFQGKLTAHIQLQRAKATEKALAKAQATPEKPAKKAGKGAKAVTAGATPLPEALAEITALVAAADYEAPLLSDRYNTNGAEGVLTRYQYSEIQGRADGCDYVEVGVFADGNRIGKTAKICRQPDCPKHGRSQSTDFTTAKTGVTPKRRQEIFDIKVAKAARHKFLAATIGKWNESEWAFNYDFLLHLIIAQMYHRTGWTGQKEICALAGIETNDLESYGGDDRAVLKTAQKIAQLTSAQQAQLMYGLLVQPFGGDENRSNWHSQEVIEGVAGQLDGDYRLWDAEARLELASKKHKPVAQAYFDLVTAGDKETAKPEFWA